MQAGLAQMQFASARVDEDVLGALPQADVVVTRVAHPALGGFGHEAGLDPVLLGHLMADLAVRDEAVSRDLAVVEHPVEFQLARIFVVTSIMSRPMARA